MNFFSLLNIAAISSLIFVLCGCSPSRDISEWKMFEYADNTAELVPSFGKPQKDEVPIDVFDISATGSIPPDQLPPQLLGYQSKNGRILSKKIE